MEMKINAYKNYNDEVEVDIDTVLVSMWNAYIEAEGSDNKISFNGKDFFENVFENAYDAVMAVSLSGGRWRWTDTFAYFDDEGYLVSFSRFEDERCPIDVDKIDIDYLIRALQDLQMIKNRKE